MILAMKLHFRLRAEYHGVEIFQ